MSFEQVALNYGIAGLLIIIIYFKLDKIDQKLNDLLCEIRELREVQSSKGKSQG